MIKANAIKAGRLAAAIGKAQAEKQLGEQYFNDSMMTDDVKQLCTFVGIDFVMVDYWANYAAYNENKQGAEVEV